MITSKFIYCKTRGQFEDLKPDIQEGINPIVFIEKTREIWTCGTYFGLENVAIVVSETSGVINVTFGNSSFTISTSGNGISARKGEGNNIILTSNALTTITTESPLKWDTIAKKLVHLESKVIAGIYGQTSNVSNASILSIPSFTVDSYGHIVSARTSNVQIRDYVEQLAVSSNNETRNILQSYDDNSGSSTSQIRKAKELTYNDYTGVFSAPKAQFRGNVTVSNGDIVVTEGYIIGKIKGDVEGSATPKIHLSTKPEYGGASKTLYGHVTLQDSVPEIKPDSSSDNANISNSGVVAVAASPLMVWNSIQEMQEYVNTHGIKVGAITENGESKDISSGFTFTNDFAVDDNNNISIGWIEL